MKLVGKKENSDSPFCSSEAQVAEVFQLPAWETRKQRQGEDQGEISLEDKVAAINWRPSSDFKSWQHIFIYNI